MSKKIKKPVLEYVWKDRKRNFLGLPWTFTKYRLTKDRLFIITGLFNTREDEVRLYRITDTTMTRSFGQKLTGTGTIHCDSADQTMKNFDIKNIKHPREFKELFSDLVETSRRENRVYMRENMGGGHGMPPRPGDDPDSLGYEPDEHDWVEPLDEDDATDNN